MSKITAQMVIEGVNKTQKAFGDVNSGLTTMSSTAKRAGLALAGAFSVGVIANWVKQTTLATAEMQKMAGLSGSTVEEFQKWGYAAQSVGIEQDKLGDIFKDVQDKVGDFLQTGGGPMADFFEKIAPQVGVTAEQFRNLSGPAALELFVSSLDKANLSQSEMTFYMESIANDATLLLPLLRDNAKGYNELAAEAEKLGVVLSGEDAAGAREFQRNLQTMGAISEGVSKQISAELVPTLNEMNGLFIDVAKEGGYASQVANVLGFGIKVLSTAAIIGGNAFGSLGRYIGGAAAAAASVAKGEFKQAADIIRMVGEDNARETGLAMERIKGLWSGAHEQAGQAATEVKTKWAGVHSSMVSNAKVASEQLKQSYDSIAKVAKQRIKEITDAERNANSEVEKLRNQRLDIEKRYADAIAQFQGGSSGPSFGGMQTLKAAAGRAMKDGNYDEAQKQAAAALKMLQELAAAGENTYGFTGIAQQLKAIEVEATQLQQTAADKKLADLSAELDALKDKSEIKVKVDMSPEEITKVTQQIQSLAQTLGEQFVITPTIVLGTVDTSQLGSVQGAPSEPVRRASGGIVRGPGTATSDSIPALLSNGEYVIRAAAVGRLGQGFLDLLNNGMPFSRFADGGLVGAAIESESAAVAPSFPKLGTVNLNMPGGHTSTVYTSPSEALSLRRLAMKFGQS